METINDVARHAGVSSMTVSRVINNNGYVKEETRKRVEQSISDLNFRPNMMARGLVTGRSHTLAHVMLDIDDMIHVMVNKGFEEACYKSGYSTIVCDANSKDRENDYINMILDKQIDGAIFHHLNISEEQLTRMESSGVKCVLIDNEIEIKNACNIYTDNYRGGYLAGKHLIERGHTELGCMFGIMKKPKNIDGEVEYIDTFQFDIWKKRTKGFCDALKEHGIKLNSNYFYQCDGTMKYGMKKAHDIMEKILQKNKRPTAIYCENDVMAIGAINALLEHKMDVPRDIAIVGHDGLEIGNVLYPRLTTIEQPRYEVGHLAATFLIENIEGIKANTSITLEPKLKIRDTT